MNPPSLFDTIADPDVRTDDPPTSKVAAKQLDVNAREAEVTEALRWLVCASDTHDIQRVLAEHGLRRDRNCVARRLTSLERKGLVRRCGFKDATTGRRTTLWRLA